MPKKLIFSFACSYAPVVGSAFLICNIVYNTIMIISNTALNVRAIVRYAFVAAFAVALAMFMMFARGRAFAAEVHAEGADGSASMVSVFSYGWSDGAYHLKNKASSSSHDVTGDGKRDTVTVKTSKGKGAGLLSSVRVIVNGKTASKLKRGSAYFDKVDVAVIKLANGQPLLYVSALKTDGTAIQKLLQFNGRKFSSAGGNGLLAKDGVSNAYISKLTPVGNRVIAEFEFSSAVTGVSRTSFTYVWGDGGLALMSDTTGALRFASTKTGVFTTQSLTAARDLTAYSDAGMSTVAFVVAKGQKARPVGLRVAGSQLFYQIQYGTQTGWIACPKSSGKVGKVFSGVYGAVSLKSKAIKYSPTKKLSAAKLQRLDNRALYLVRNEIYARHGTKYKQGELKYYFSKKGWYKPKKVKKSALTKADKSNIELIQSLEQNRRSPYA